MSRIFDFSGVQTSRYIPNAHVSLKVVGLEERLTKANGCLMYVIDNVVTAPASQAGKQYTEFCVFGTTPFETNSEDPDFVEYAELDDPQAEDPLTARFSMGMRDFKRIFEGAGIDFTKPVSMADLVDIASSGELNFGAHVSLDTDETTGKQRNHINAVYQTGKEEPRLIADKKKGKPAGKAKAAAKGASGGAAAHSAKARTRKAVEQTEEADVEIDGDEDLD